ncbi:uncharacterized protein LOC120422154 [Culex pipiens pallens]|uniref:uncharacterized protein LOC120422154 n=1 Tax=Culex pipiens pallens TaxID=42434 RepID=UPI0022AA4A66|nr:uncharacterized protein LOC120422154 [Culex pipiens pallens]
MKIIMVYTCPLSVKMLTFSQWADRFFSVPCREVIQMDPWSVYLSDSRKTKRLCSRFGLISKPPRIRPTKTQQLRYQSCHHQKFLSVLCKMENQPRFIGIPQDLNLRRDMLDLCGKQNHDPEASANMAAQHGETNLSVHSEAAVSTNSKMAHGLRGQICCNT